MSQDMDDEQYAALIQMLGHFLPDAEYQVIDTHGKALSLRERAKAMVGYAETSTKVSDAICKCVIGGEHYVAQLWDAKTLGTHGVPTSVLVMRRYDAAKRPAPQNTAGKTVGCLTIDELQDGMAAGKEFSDWLYANAQVSFTVAETTFIEIGRRHKTSNVDKDIEFVWELKHAQRTLAWLAQEGHLE